MWREEEREGEGGIEDMMMNGVQRLAEKTQKLEREAERERLKM